MLGLVRVRERLTVEAAARRYVEYLTGQGRKHATLVAVESALTQWLAPHFDDKALDRISPADVEDLMRRMRAKGLSAKSIRNYVGTLSALLNYAVRKR
jgi:site-specific recombinase XerC